MAASVRSPGEVVEVEEEGERGASERPPSVASPMSGRRGLGEFEQDEFAPGLNFGQAAEWRQ